MSTIEKEESKKTKEPELKGRLPKNAPPPRTLEDDIGCFADDPKCGRTKFFRDRH